MGHQVLHPGRSVVTVVQWRHEEAGRSCSVAIPCYTHGSLETHGTQTCGVVEMMGEQKLKQGCCCYPMQEEQVHNALTKTSWLELLPGLQMILLGEAKK